MYSQPGATIGTDGVASGGLILSQSEEKILQDKFSFNWLLIYWHNRPLKY